MSGARWEVSALIEGRVVVSSMRGAGAARQCAREVSAMYRGQEVLAYPVDEAGRAVGAARVFVSGKAVQS